MNKDKFFENDKEWFMDLLDRHGALTLLSNIAQYAEDDPDNIDDAAREQLLFEGRRLLQALHR